MPIAGPVQAWQGRQRKTRRDSQIVMAATALGLAMMGYASGDDDRWKRWKKREQWDKDNYWMFSFSDVDYRIPEAVRNRCYGNPGRRGFETAFMLRRREEQVVEVFGYAVLKIASDQLSMNLVPSIGPSILDIYANKDSFSGRLIETMSMERLKKDYRFNAGTSMFARGASTGNTIASVAGMGNSVAGTDRSSGQKLLRLGRNSVGGERGLMRGP